MWRCSCSRWTRCTRPRCRWRSTCSSASSSTSSLWRCCSRARWLSPPCALSASTCRGRSRRSRSCRSPSSRKTRRSFTRFTCSSWSETSASGARRDSFPRTTVPHTLRTLSRSLARRRARRVKGSMHRSGSRAARSEWGRKMKKSNEPSPLNRGPYVPGPWARQTRTNAAAACCLPK
eukprot:Amastigsp_a8083_12.p3 type:complete len:177 gc:universal Amastigsp_a8083_12:332-862(+)